MQVSAILAAKGHDVATAEADVPIMTIIEELARRNIGAIVVIDAARAVLGIISERDVVRALARHGASVLDQPVSSYMTRKVITCSPGESTHELMTRMSTGRFRHLPVITEGTLDGIISIGDVVKARIADVQREAEALREYIAFS